MDMVLLEVDGISISSQVRFILYERIKHFFWDVTRGPLVSKKIYLYGVVGVQDFLFVLFHVPTLISRSLGA